MNTKLERLPVPNEEEQTLLSNLNLTIEQYIAISLKTPYLTKEEEEFIINNYLTFNLQAKLQLLSSGLNNLGIDTAEKKEKFIELILTCQQEQQSFGLSTKEKENILRFLMNTLDLSPEQKSALEEMGIKPYNASEWEVSDEQKNHLLDFGLNKLTLTEEQQEKLTVIHSDQLKTFSLAGSQKNILNSLAPLIREDKYSEKSLALFKSLHLKPNNQTFLVQEEIIPDPHTAFGTSKNNYLPLKEKFLKGEQKVLRKAKEQEEKKNSKEEIRQQKLSILRSLMTFSDEVIDVEYLKDFNYSLADWVKEGILTNWQSDILLTVGFKTIPKYNFFELLIFCVEKFAETNWSEFLAGNEDLFKEFKHYLEELRNNPEITINETIWEKFASSQSSQQREIIQQLNLKELIEEQINQRLGNWTPSEEISKEASEENISEETSEPQPSSSRYDKLLAGLNEEEAKRMKKKLEREEAQKKLQEQERLRRESKLSEKDRKLKEKEEQRQKERELAEAEEKKREEARLAREKTLQEEQDAYFSTKTKNLAERKKAIDAALENKKKENELEEQKKKDQIDKMEKENQEEQARLSKQSQLIAEELTKKLAQIALEDEEERQAITKKANAEKARIEEEILEIKRKNEIELKKKENQLKKERETREEEIRKMEADKLLAEKEEKENRALYEQEKKSRQDLETKRANALIVNTERMDAKRQSETLKENNAERALRSILWYPMLKEEWNRCTRNGSHFDTCPTVKDGFDRYPSLKVNPGLFQFDSGKWKEVGNSSKTWVYSRAVDLRITAGICKDGWFTKSELESHIRNNITEKWPPN